MILDVKDAIFKKLKSAFPDHKLYGEKVKQGLSRPCFFVDILPIDVNFRNKDMMERSIIVDVQYMSKEDTKEKNQEMSEQLIPLFEALTLPTGDIRLINQRFEILDGILHLLFDIDVLVKIDRSSIEEPQELMGELHLR